MKGQPWRGWKSGFTLIAEGRQREWHHQPRWNHSKPQDSLASFPGVTSKDDFCFNCLKIPISKATVCKLPKNYMRNRTLTAFIFRVRKEQLTFASTSNYFVELCQNLQNSPVQPFIQKPDKTRQGILSFCSSIKSSSSELKLFNPTSNSHNGLRELK